MRRLYGFQVSDTVIGMFCTNGNRSFSVTGPIPETAKFWSAYFDNERNNFVVIFEDESFPPVEEGQPIPIDRIGPMIKEIKLSTPEAA